MLFSPLYILEILHFLCLVHGDEAVDNFVKLAVHELFQFVEGLAAAVIRVFDSFIA